jgi:hypothetical protein
MALLERLCLNDDGILVWSFTCEYAHGPWANQAKSRIQDCRHWVTEEAGISRAYKPLTKKVQFPFPNATVMAQLEPWVQLL